MSNFHTHTHKVELPALVRNQGLKKQNLLSGSWDFCLCIIVLDRISLCKPSVAQTELTKIELPRSPECWDYSISHHPQLQQ